MPKDVVLDGELFTKRGDFSKIMSTVSKNIPDTSEWKNIKYMVFDLPMVKEPFEIRYNLLKNIVTKNNSEYLKLVKHVKIKSKKHLQEFQEDILEKGGEGVMIRKDNSMYHNGRSSQLLKLKTFRDDEAVVVDYELGSGKYSNIMGKLLVKWLKGPFKNTEFYVGSGFNDSQRTNYKKLYPKGTIVKIKYFSINQDSGKPRFPTFIGIRSKKDI